MYLSTIICILFLTVCEFEAKSIQSRSKRDLKEQILADPNGCIRKCSEEAPMVEEIPDDDPIYENQFVQICSNHKKVRDCVTKCRTSPGKSLLMETYASLNIVCEASNPEIAAGSNCIYNVSQNILTSCMHKCHPEEYWEIIPDVFADFDGANASNAIVVLAEKDTNLVQTNLTALCLKETCMINCQKSPIQKKCGQKVADYYSRGYAAWVKSLPNIYVTLKVIQKSPVECDNVAA